MDKRNAVVADVYTDPKGQKVLKEAIGNSFIIYAIVPDQNGNLRVVSGATYSYYEFSESSSNRLTDENGFRVSVRIPEIDSL